MRILVWCLFLALAPLVVLAEYDLETHTYTQVVQTRGTPEELYFKAGKWVAITFVDAEKVFDKGLTLIERAYTTPSDDEKTKIRFDITIEARDGRARIKIDRLIWDLREHWDGAEGTRYIWEPEPMTDATLWSKAAIKRRFGFSDKRTDEFYAEYEVARQFCVKAISTIGESFTAFMMTKEEDW